MSIKLISTGCLNCGTPPVRPPWALIQTAAGRWEVMANTVISTRPYLTMVQPCISVVWWLITLWSWRWAVSVHNGLRMVNELCSQSILPPASLYLHYLLQYPLTSTPARCNHTCTRTCTHRPPLISGFSQVVISLPMGHITYRGTSHERSELFVN